MFYAQLDNKGICVAVSQLLAKVESKDMIALESYDTTVCGKKYNDGKWEEASVGPIPEPSIILSGEELQAEILLNQQQIITRQNTQEAVLAQLLLNQQGGVVNV